MNIEPTTETPPSIGVILAGGAGTRLGGIDKGLMNVNGQPLVEHVLEHVSPQVDKVMIVANRHLDSYAAYGHTVLSDSLPGFAGPLAGMLSGLRKARELHPQAACLFVPVDAPRLPGDLYERLNSAAGTHGLAVAATPDGLQPVCNLVSVHHLHTLEQDFNAGERSPAAWLKAQGASDVDFSDNREAIWSVNTPEELLQTQQALLSSTGTAA